jgi:hypothetical protein
VKWEERFPDAQVGDMPMEDLQYSATRGPCVICEKSTAWIDLHKQMFICSEECCELTNCVPADAETQKIDEAASLAAAQVHDPLDTPVLPSKLQELRRRWYRALSDKVGELPPTEAQLILAAATLIAALEEELQYEKDNRAECIKNEQREYCTGCSSWDMCDGLEALSKARFQLSTLRALVRGARGLFEELEQGTTDEMCVWCGGRATNPPDTREVVIEHKDKCRIAEWLQSCSETVETDPALL